MRQMLNGFAPVIAVVRFNRLSQAFFKKRRGSNKVFFVSKSGENNLVFPVLEDGSISLHGKGEDLPYPSEEVFVLDPKDLGITEIEWS